MHQKHIRQWKIVHWIHVGEMWRYSRSGNKRSTTYMVFAVVIMFLLLVFQAFSELI